MGVNGRFTFLSQWRRRAVTKQHLNYNNKERTFYKRKRSTLFQNKKIEKEKFNKN